MTDKRLNSATAKELKPLIARMVSDLAAKAKTGAGVLDPYAIILYDASAQVIRKYSVSEDGMTAALANSASGDGVFFPEGTLTSDFTVPAGVSLFGADRDKCIFTGKITLADGVLIENLTISRTGSSSATCILGPSSGTAYAVNCKLSCVLTGGTPLVYTANGGDMEFHYCDITCTLNGADAAPFGVSGYTGPTSWTFDSDLEGWAEDAGSSFELAWDSGKLAIWSAGAWAPGTVRYTFTENVFITDGTTLDFDFVNAPNSFIVFGMAITLPNGHVGPLLLSDPDGHETITVTDPINIGWGNESSAGAILNSIYITADPGVYGDAHRTLDNVVIDGIIAGSGNVYVQACTGTAGYGIPLSGDRAVFDALNYQTLHANDVNNVAGIHWTGGTLDARYAIRAYDEGILAGTITAVNLTGDGGTLTYSGGTAVINIPGGGAASGVLVYDEGVFAGTATSLNFTGDGGTATYSGGTATINITGGAFSGIPVYDEGIIAGTATSLNVTGAGGTLTYSGGTAVIDIPGGGAAAFTDLTDTFAAYTGLGGQFLRVKASVDGIETAAIAGGGDVLGPATSTDEHLAVWDGTNSKTLKDGGAVPAGGSGSVLEVQVFS